MCTILTAEFFDFLNFFFWFFMFSYFANFAANMADDSEKVKLQDPASLEQKESLIQDGAKTPKSVEVNVVLLA